MQYAQRNGSVAMEVRSVLRIDPQVYDQNEGPRSRTQTPEQELHAINVMYRWSTPFCAQDRTVEISLSAHGRNEDDRCWRRQE